MQKVIKGDPLTGFKVYEMHELMNCFVINEMYEFTEKAEKPAF